MSNLLNPTPSRPSLRLIAYTDHSTDITLCYERPDGRVSRINTRDTHPIRDLVCQTDVPLVSLNDQYDLELLRQLLYDEAKDAIALNPGSSVLNWRAPIALCGRVMYLTDEEMFQHSRKQRALMGKRPGPAHLSDFPAQLRELIERATHVAHVSPYYHVTVLKGVRAQK